MEESKEGNQKWSEEQLRDISQQARVAMQVIDRKYRFKTYKACFVGKDLALWLKANDIVQDDETAVALGQQMLEHGYFKHVCGDHDFKPQALFYRFKEDEPDRGHTEESESWHSLLATLKDRGSIAPKDLPAALGNASDLIDKNDPDHLPHMFFDEHNCDLFDNVHPIKWVDPKAEGKYDMLVIGGGAGGLVTAAGSAGCGAKVAIIERNFLGGDCLNNGCVPSKAFLKCANVINAARTASEYGIEITGEIKCDFKKVMARMRKIRAEISENDSANRFSKALGVDVYMGNARFTGRNSVEVNGKTLTFLKACIATGGRPAKPNIFGIENIPHFTSDNIWNLNTQPKNMVIVGAGPIGAELGQAFQRLGSQVTFVCRGPNFLPREDRDAAQHLVYQLQQDGVKFMYNSTIKQVDELEPADYANDKLPNLKLIIQQGQDAKEMEVDTLMFAIGRIPNVTGMGLEEAGVQYDPDDGIYTNEHLKTSNGDIFSVGDCLALASNAGEAKTHKGPGFQFTHNSDVQARSVVRNALFFGSIDKRTMLVPWSTYTEPEIAHVGKYSWQLDSVGVPYDTYTKFYQRLDRALCEGKRGFVKIHVKKGSDEILGATAVGGPAGELVCLLTSGMYNGLGLSKIGACVYPYPSWAEGIKHLADQYNKKQVGGKSKAVVQTLFSLRK